MKMYNNLDMDTSAKSPLGSSGNFLIVQGM